MNKIATAALAGLLMPIMAQAATITDFEENFDGENGGVTGLNYNSFAQFSVTDGTVDVNSGGDWGITCYGGSGSCVDLDGSSLDAGVMTSTPISIAADTLYTLSFAMSGSQRWGTDSVTAGVTGVINASFTAVLDYDAPWETYTLQFSGPLSGDVSIFFANAGGDYVGAVIDNVSLTHEGDSPAPVPLPAGIMLLGGGLAALGFSARKARRA